MVYQKLCKNTRKLRDYNWKVIGSPSIRLGPDQKKKINK